MKGMKEILKNPSSGVLQFTYFSIPFIPFTPVNCFLRSIPVSYFTNHEHTSSRR